MSICISTLVIAFLSCSQGHRFSRYRGSIPSTASAVSIIDLSRGHEEPLAVDKHISISPGFADPARSSTVTDVTVRHARLLSVVDASLHNPVDQQSPRSVRSFDAHEWTGSAEDNGYATADVEAQGDLRISSSMTHSAFTAC